MKKTYYEKVGKRYKPIAEYDTFLFDSFPKGATLVICQPGSTSKKYNIDPDYAALIAAAKIAEDAMVSHMYNASEISPSRRPLTQEETDAWNNLIDVWGPEAKSLTHPSVKKIVEAGVEALIDEANKLLTNPAVKIAYDRFLMVAQLSKEK